MGRRPARPVGPSVRFTADHDHTPDHRTIAYTAGLVLPAADLFEPFAVDSLADLAEALEVYGVPAEISEA